MTETKDKTKVETQHENKVYKPRYAYLDSLDYSVDEETLVDFGLLVNPTGRVQARIVDN